MILVAGLIGCSGFVPKRAATQLDEVQVNQSGQQNHVILRNVLEAYGE
jgi:hypothetical protein